MSSIAVEQKIHLMDLAFCKFCEEEYGINRGVYNTIDAWFYENGVVDILLRRKEIVEFLEYVSKGVRRNGRHPKIKFGRKVLALKLREYYNNPPTGVDSSSTTNFSM